jgi:hypothetical protein
MWRRKKRATPQCTSFLHFISPPPIPLHQLLHATCHASLPKLLHSTLAFASRWSPCLLRAGGGRGVTYHLHCLISTCILACCWRKPKPATPPDKFRNSFPRVDKEPPLGQGWLIFLLPWLINYTVFKLLNLTFYYGLAFIEVDDCWEWVNQSNPTTQDHFIEMGTLE